MEQIEHPEGKIILLNGSIIEAFEKEEKGRYEVDKDTQRLRSLFEENAIDLYHHKIEIYNDSRMFLTPVDMGCHLAYFGTSGLEGATLGVWIEWWDSVEKSRTDEKGNERLITFFSGSPLSGSNRCIGVSLFRKKISFSFSKDFLTIWHSFSEINKRYYGLTQKYESYSLEETLIKLN